MELNDNIIWNKFLPCVVAAGSIIFILAIMPSAVGAAAIATSNGSAKNHMEKKSEENKYWTRRTKVSIFLLLSLCGAV